MDISENQVKKAEQYLTENGLSAKLICSSMENECGIPTDYFDFVFSVYAIGWTTDLEGTFRRVASYLKNNGIFIFSWSHPVHKCVTTENGILVFRKSYFDESWYSMPLGEGVISLSDRKLSTYVNALAKAGFCIEQMVEEFDEDMLQDRNDENTIKARMIPKNFVVKAKKL